MSTTALARSGGPLRLPLLRTIGVPLLALVVAFGGAALFMTLLGYNALRGYGFMLEGSLGSKWGLSETFVRMTPLLIAGLGVGIAFRSGIFNIGGEGQIYLGALAATVVGLKLSGPPLLILPLELLAGFAAGAALGLVAGALKARWDVNEVITTIMLNYIGVMLVAYMIRGPLVGTGGWSFGAMTDRLPESASLPILLEGTRLHAGILIGLVLAVAVWFLLWKTTLGYKLRAAGENMVAARYGGIKVRQNIALVMLLSGGLCGVVGMIEIAGVQHRLMDGISAAFGWDACIVALLGRRHPLGIAIAAFALAVVAVGARSMEQGIGIPFALTYVIQGLMVLCLMGADLYLQK